MAYLKSSYPGMSGLGFGMGHLGSPHMDSVSGIGPYGSPAMDLCK